MEKDVQNVTNANAQAKIILLLMIFSLLGFIYGSVDVIKLQDFSIIIVSIIIQAFPFLLFGTMVSSLIRSFVSDETIVKFFPQKGFIATLSAIGIGVFLPLCDCAVVPVAARLRNKGVPVHAVVTFMMAAPIVNPVVILSTIYAFPGTNIVIYRIIAGVMIAIFTGAFLRIFYNDNCGEEVLKDSDEHNRDECVCASHEIHINCQDHKKRNICGCGSHHHTRFDVNINGSPIVQKILDAFIHSGEEFFQVSKLFIIGVFITSAIQVFVSKSIMTTYAGNPYSAVLIMMIIAFVMSICSTSDSFIGRSFMSTVPMSGIFGFVVFGPVLDLKNMMMMMGYFKKKFVGEFVFTAFVTAYVVIVIMSVILFR